MKLKKHVLRLIEAHYSGRTKNFDIEFTKLFEKYAANDDDWDMLDELNRSKMLGEMTLKYNK